MKDIDVLKEVINSTWKFNEFFSKRAANTTAKVFLLDCLSQQTFTCIAEKANLYMKEENVKNFYLYTDTMCTYQFYEKQGMLRKGAKKSFSPSNKEELTNFIYDKYI